VFGNPNYTIRSLSEIVVYEICILLVNFMFLVYIRVFISSAANLFCYINKAIDLTVRSPAVYQVQCFKILRSGEFTMWYTLSPVSLACFVFKR
jgi:hypothetical protein